MKGKVVKERVIYDNYDLEKIFPDNVLIETAKECGWVDEDEEITEEMLWNWRYHESQMDWKDTWEELKAFFKSETVGFFGEVGLWHGTYKAGKIGEFEQLFWRAVEDCDYFKFYDENGHMYLTCSHHDGTNHFEIKILTDKGIDYLERWEDDWNDKRTEQYVHNQIFNKYSRIPKFVEKQYGCKAREYESITKGRLIDMLNNQANSRYSA